MFDECLEIKINIVQGKFNVQNGCHNLCYIKQYYIYVRKSLSGFFIQIYITKVLCQHLASSKRQRVEIGQSI